MEVKQGEHGLVRLFKLDLPDGDVQTILEPAALKRALGAKTIDTDFVEIITLADLADFGLNRYLIEGLGIAEDEVAPHVSTLDSLKGHLLVVTSSAFSGPQSLSIKAPLRWIATLKEEAAKTPLKHLTSDSASGEASGTGGTAPPPSSGKGLWIFPVIALVLIAAIWFAK